MIRIRRAGERGHFDHGWLNTYHTFSFGDYQDDRFMGFRALRVINEDRVKPGQGFGTHGHRDMEILTYVLEGALAHRDSLGTGSVIVPGDLQYMSAGRGVRHSEFNHSATEPVHFMQIWILPNAQGLPPLYGQKRFEQAQRAGRFCLIASGDGRDGSIQIRQDVDISATVLPPGASVSLALRNGRHLWAQALRGGVDVNGNRLEAGDGISASGETAFVFTAGDYGAELMVFDLA
ncbi:MAG: pirin family protein [Acidobacteriota bacterium]